MAGYWPSSSLCIKKQDKVKVNKNIKKEGGQYPAILTSCLGVNKGFVVWPEKELILAGPK